MFSESYVYLNPKSADFLNGLVQLPFLEVSFITFLYIKMKILSESANSVETCKTGVSKWHFNILFICYSSIKVSFPELCE
jgi:hypothetical protein